VVARFIKQALAGEPWVIYGDGYQSRDFIFVDDVVQALITAARAGLGGNVFQIGTSRQTTVLELVQQLAEALAETTGARPTVKHASSIAGEVRRNYSDISKAIEVLEWRPRTDLERGLRETVQWFANRER
jgi:UDP-glucose 4-epimerase